MPIVFIITVYAATFVICSMIGTGTGMQSYYLVAAALVVLYVGTERIILASALVAGATALVIALQVLVPHNTGLQSDATLFGNFIVTRKPRYAFAVDVCRCQTVCGALPGSLQKCLNKRRRRRR